MAALYPNRCPFCDSVIGVGEYYCEPCRRHIPYLYGKLEPPQHVSRLLACCSYSGKARRAVLSMKYGKLVYPADAFAEMMCEKLRDAKIEADFLVPVPSGFLSVKKRGFSTGELLCRKVSERSGIPVLEAVLARDEKEEQKKFSKKKRIENALKSFYLADDADVGGKRLVLIDDLATTGSTLSAVASILLAAGAADVSACVFAKTMLCTRSENGKLMRFKGARRFGYRRSPE